jgi:DNA recombination protein RmuC
MEFVFLLTGLIVGLAIGWLIGVFNSKSKISKLSEDILNVEKDKIVAINLIDKEKSILNERLTNSVNEIENTKKEYLAEKQRADIASERIAKAEVEYKNLLEKLNTQKAEVEDLQKKFTTEFENIAHKILKQNSAEFTETNFKNIGEILNPLKEKITSFEKKVEDAYDKEIRDKVDLKAELKSLHELNKKISEEANNLTKALKGDNKKQGNWGEFVLDRILERSGLNKDIEYKTQFSTNNDEGKRIQPDVVVFLPDKKHIIIDSKVSLIAYENFVNAITEEERQKFAKEHILSLRTHIKSLSEKKYQDSEAFNSPDFTLMFIPIESSFSVAIQHDQEIFNFAWESKIVIVSPSTLLATLKTISSLWKQENQTKNAMEIAKQAGNMLDKFTSFVADLEKVGKNIDTSKATFNEAMNKLKTGTGNLVKRAEDIKKLGVKINKVLPLTSIEENNITTDLLDE